MLRCTQTCMLLVHFLQVPSLEKCTWMMMRLPDPLVLITEGAQTLAGLNSTGYSGGTTQFTAAIQQSVGIQRCLQDARVNASTAAASAATQARAALLAGNATAAAAAIQSALCDPVTATATAEVFAEIISSSVGCNGTVQTAIASKTIVVTVFRHGSAALLCTLCIMLALHSICCSFANMHAPDKNAVYYCVSVHRCSHYWSHVCETVC